MLMVYTPCCIGHSTGCTDSAGCMGVMLNLIFWNDSDGRSIRISPVVIWLAGPPIWMRWNVELEAWKICFDILGLTYWALL